METETVHLILVHGAWQGKWVWPYLEKHLDTEKFKCHTFDLPGSGSDITELSSVSLESYASKIIAETESLASGKKILLGHSMGGAAITAAATKRPDLFSQLVYLCAFLPKEGQSVFLLSQQGHTAEFSGPRVTINDSKTLSTLVPDSIADTFFNDIDRAKSAAHVSLFKPQALAPVTTPASSWSTGFRDLPKSYILCTEDNAISPDLQREMAENANIIPTELKSGHEPFIIIPEILAEHLMKIIAEKSETLSFKFLK